MDKELVLYANNGYLIDISKEVLRQVECKGKALAADLNSLPHTTYYSTSILGEIPEHSSVSLEHIWLLSPKAKNAKQGKVLYIL